MSSMTNLPIFNTSNNLTILNNETSLDSFNQEKQLSEINQKISIKFKARNARKGITTIIGLQTFDIDLNKMAAQIKKKFGCASYVKEVEGQTVIEIQGDKTGDIYEILIKDYKISPKKISSL
jgi:density-regulated protein DRP1